MKIALIGGFAGLVGFAAAWSFAEPGYNVTFFAVQGGVTFCILSAIMYFFPQHRP